MSTGCTRKDRIAYRRIKVGGVSETEIGLCGDNIAFTGIASYSGLSYLSRVSSTGNIRNWVWFPAFNLTINKPFQVRPFRTFQ